VYGRFATIELDWGKKKYYIKPFMVDPPLPPTKKNNSGKKIKVFECPEMARFTFFGCLFLIEGYISEIGDEKTKCSLNIFMTGREKIRQIGACTCAHEPKRCTPEPKMSVHGPYLIQGGISELGAAKTKCLCYIFRNFFWSQLGACMFVHKPKMCVHKTKTCMHKTKTCVHKPKTSVHGPFLIEGVISELCAQPQFFCGAKSECAHAHTS
jgi:hypothetical protein